MHFGGLVLQSSLEVWYSKWRNQTERTESELSLAPANANDHFQFIGLLGSGPDGVGSREGPNHSVNTNPEIASFPFASFRHTSLV
jgi:hypothetical protein